MARLVIKILVIALFCAMSVDFAFRVAGHNLFVQKGGSYSSKVIEDYIMSNPEVIFKSIEGFNNMRLEMKKVAIKKWLSENNIVYDNDPKFGAKNPKVTVVQFIDYNCGYCKKSLAVQERILNEMPNVRFVVKGIPLFGEKSIMSIRAAEAAYNADPSKYLAYHKELFGLNDKAGNKDAYFNIAQKVGIDSAKFKESWEKFASYNAQDNIQIAQELGINGTPVLVIGSNVIVGDQGFEELKEVIKNAK